MSDSQWREKADQHSSAWIDTDDSDSGSISQGLPLDDQTSARVADLQLLDAMLASMAGGIHGDQSSRIDRLMDAIPDEAKQPELRPNIQPSLKSRTSFFPWPTLIALAACFLAVCAFSSVLLMSESRAGALLPQINEVAIQSIDRVYNLRRTVQSPQGAREEISGRLYLRGVEGFVLTCGDAVFGRDASEFWFVSPSGEVIIAENFAWMIEKSEKQRQELGLLKELSLESTRVPLMELSSVVQLMQHDYQVTVNSGLRHGQQVVDELVGKRKSGNTELPDTIRLWSGAESRIIHFAQFIWGNEKEISPPNTLVFVLVDAVVVPTDWYRHEAHH
jgi:hypothetical protein